MSDEVRDLEADLELCNCATPGPWVVMSESIATAKTDRDGWHDGIIRPRTPRPRREIMRFIAEARQGWPYAIQRAQEAEQEVDRLRNELDMLQEQLSLTATIKYFLSLSSKILPLTLLGRGGVHPP